MYSGYENDPISISINKPLLSGDEDYGTYSLAAMTRKRPMTAEDAEGHSSSTNKDPALVRCLGWPDLITYGLGSTVGAGIFVITGKVASTVAGPGIVLSFLFAGLASLISAFSYSEFSARIPLSGSAYTFAYATLGELVGWFIGWDLTLEYAISASAVAQAWNSTIGSFFQIFSVTLPTWVTGTDVNSWVALYPLSAFIVILCTVILLFGVKDSARFNMVITVINMTTIVFLIVTGAFYTNSKNWTNNFLPWGIGGVIAGSGNVFFSFIGFDSVTTLAGEVKTPKRDLPIGIVGTLVIATSMYMASSFVITGMQPYQDISEGAAFQDAFLAHGLKWAATIIIIGSLTTMTATTLCSLLGQPRIYFSMARDGLMWPAFAKLNKHQVPVFGTLVTGVFASFFALFWNIDELSNMISVGTLLAFTLVSAGVITLRYGDSPYPPKLPLIPILCALFAACVAFGLVVKFNLEYYYMIAAFVVFLGLVILLYVIKPRDIQMKKDVFSCPWVPGLPAVGMLVNTIMITHVDKWALLRVVVWAAVGMAIYFLYGIKHSKLIRTKQPSKNYMEYY